MGMVGVHRKEKAMKPFGGMPYRNHGRQWSIIPSEMCVLNPDPWWRTIEFELIESIGEWKVKDDH